ncbi:non-ribosomal peptide synthetase [Actinocrispum wychmicini]|uniref:Amino acid adenylation domain-containing protein n=1 Tax=Actinocrispum wychmicini TaxID=1213861 RepID=A0A4R2JUB2_9PSEU|nr:non-ribosomal peptide synthetase [Actinocrispum wychmicini]TCO60856.1 amino acid adenylation domain-containing protein [Actinocrispum wychmicini]
MSGDSGSPETSLAEARRALLAMKMRQRQAAAAERDRIVRVPRSGRLAVTEQQHYIWFLHQVSVDLAQYNIPFVLRLRGELDEPALRKAVRDVVNRHESLRTTFGVDRGVPFQIVADPVTDVPVTVTDLSGLAEDERWAKGLSVAMAEIRVPFDLATGPLLRCGLVRLAAADHLLVMTFHHIITDGWSTGLLIRDLAEFYDAAHTGREARLPELAVAPVDVAVWQRRQLTGPGRERDLEYWRGALKDLPTLDFPADKPRPLTPTGRGLAFVRPFPGDLLRAARDLAAQWNISELSVYAAAFAIVLARYTGQTDIPFGSAVSARTRHELESMVGMFANTVVLRIDLTGDPTVAELLRRSNEHVLDVLAHQDVPFGRVVEDLRPERDAARNPLYQVALSLLSEEIMADFAFGDVRVENVEVHTGTSRFDLSVQLNTRSVGDGFVWVNYADDLFDPERMERLVVHFRTALEAIVADPAQPVAGISVLPEEERRRLVAEWNPEPVDFGTADRTLVDLVGAAAAANPAGVAVRFEGADLTYQELDRRSNCLATLLRAEYGVGLESIVGMLLERGPNVQTTELASIKAGGAWLPLDPTHPAARLRFQLEDAGADVVVTTTALAGLLPADMPRVLLDTADLESCSDSPLPQVAGPDNAAYVIYTSGSTGKPKGVVVTHRAAVNFVGAAQQLFHITPADRVLQFANPTFDVSVFDVYSALANGATCVSAPTSVLYDPHRLAELMRQESVTVADIAPAVLGLVTDTDLPELRALFVGIEAFTADLVNRWRTSKRAFHNGYGPTEATVACVDYECPPERLTAAPPIGRAMANISAFVVDGRGDLVPVGVQGELCIAGTCLARGYLGRPGLTAEKFVPCEFGGPGERMYRTGDVVRWEWNGQLVFVGRVDRQVKIRGLRVELGEIEDVLAGAPAVAQAAVVVADSDTGPRLDGYVVAERGGKLTEDSVRDWLVDRLPVHMVPATLTILAELPLTGSGKLDRKALPAPATGVAAGGMVTGTGRLLAEVWAGLLNVSADTVAGADNFFTLGGNSLQATQLISRIRDTFYVELDARQLFSHPRLNQMADLVDEAMRAAMDESELALLEKEVAELSEEELDRLLAEDE